MKMLILFLLLASFLSFPQTKISGRVTDEDGGLLPSANVYLKDTYDGFSTNTDGYYSFTTSETGEGTLVVSYIGYKTVEATVNLSGKEIVLDFTLEPEAGELDQVVISAGSFEASDEKKSVILRPLDIVTTAGAEGDIYGALQTLPGTTPVGEKEGLFVRGGDAVETKTMIDGMVVQNPYFSSIPDIPARGRFSPFIFKGTIFSTGGYSAEYGQALSSALILQSEGLAPATVSALSLMAVGLGGAHTQRWENTSLSVEGVYYDLDPYFKILPQRTDWLKVPTGWNGSAMLRQKTSESGLFKFYSTYSHDNGMSLYVDGREDPFQKEKFSLQNDDFYLNSSFSEIFGDNWTLFSGLSYSKDKDDILLSSDKIDSDEQLVQGKVTLTRTLFGNSYLIFGGEIQNTLIEESFNDLTRKLDENYYAGYAETNLFLSKSLAARAGLRIEKSNAIDEANIAPRTALAYKIGEFGTLNFAYGQFYQVPENSYLFFERNFDYEKAIHYIINYQYIDELYTFRIEGYYKDYDKLVKQLTFPEDLAEIPEYSNNGSGYAKGIDIFWRDRKSLELSDYWISYSYLDTKRDYKDFPALATPTFATPHTLSIVFKRWVPEITTYLGFTYTFATGRPYFNPNNPEYLGDRTKSYHNLSFNASYVTNFLGNMTVVYFSATNLLGINNIFGYRYSLDRTRREAIVAPVLRSAFLGMFISFEYK
jgi:hypothetical protein